jgi:elongation factor P hydroxylase
MRGFGFFVMMQKNCADLIEIFNSLFEVSENTRLLGGAEEPLYLPAAPEKGAAFAQIFFREDYFSSALHEIAHWCLSGPARRQLEDYGYWYKPDGRDDHWQSRFEEVEVKPQALECLFSRAAGIPFYVSVDNLNNPQAGPEAFAEKVDAQVDEYLNRGLPPRAKKFYQALLMFYNAAGSCVEKDSTDPLTVQSGRASAAVD